LLSVQRGEDGGQALTGHVITAFGLWARQGWAWLLAVISTGVSLITPLLALFNGSFWSVFGLIIPGIIFFYLLLDDDVKRAFGRA
jgi:uncharacterized membrane protein (DUF2068 family)